MDDTYHTGSMFYAPLYYGPNCIGSIDFNLYRHHSIKDVLELTFITKYGRKVNIFIGTGTTVVSYMSGTWEIPIINMFSPLDISMEGALYIGRNIHRFLHLKGDIRIDAEL